MTTNEHERWPRGLDSLPMPNPQPDSTTTSKNSDPNATMYGRPSLVQWASQHRDGLDTHGQDGYATGHGLEARATHGRDAHATTGAHATATPWVGAAMPWVLSLFFHLGVAMILAFAMVVSITTAQAPPIEPPTVVHNPMAQPRATVTPDNTPIRPDSPQSGQPNRMNPLREYSESFRDMTEHNIVVNHDRPNALATINPDGSTGLKPTKGPTTGGMFIQGIVGPGRINPPGGQPAKLGAVDNMIFVIDRSGSMMQDMSSLRYELKKAVRLLKPDQRFALVLFTSGEPREFVHGRMVPADTANKNEFFEYADTIDASGRTDPIPALKRAFAMAKSAPKSQYTAICLLSDGVFPDVEAAVDFVRQATRDTNIHVFTYLYGEQNKEAEMMMKRIAHEGNGSYNVVTRQ